MGRPVASSYANNLSFSKPACPISSSNWRRNCRLSGAVMSAMKDAAPAGLGAPLCPSRRAEAGRRARWRRLPFRDVAGQLDAVLLERLDQQFAAETGPRVARQLAQRLAMASRRPLARDSAGSAGALYFPAVRAK